MRSSGLVDLGAHERVLADAIVDVATELRLTDPAEFVMMVRADQAANIADLVNSSSELFFKRGALRYALAATYDLSWGSTPSVRLDMEFQHDRVTVFFRLTIGGARAAIEVIDVIFEGEQSADSRGAADLLRVAVAKARHS
jgi:hypothetical protein